MRKKFSIIKKALFVTGVFLAAAALAGEPLDTVKRAPVPEYEWSVSGNGELSVTVADNTFFR